MNAWAQKNRNMGNSVHVKSVHVKSVYVKRVLVLCAAAILASACAREQADDEATTAEAQPSGKVPVTTVSEDARDLYLQGLSMFDGVRITEANALFREAVEIDPEFARAWFMLAQSALSTAEFFDAVANARASAANASSGEQGMIQALVAGSENDQDGQLAAWNSLVNDYPDDERVHFFIGTVYFGRQNYADAEQHFSKATEINPQFASAYNMLGYSRRNTENFVAARRAFEQYIELTPDEPNPYDSYAELLLEMGEYDESIENYRKALEIDPHFTASYTGISINESLKGNHSAAQSTATTMLAAARNSTEELGALAQSVTAYLFAGDTEGAVQSCEDFLAVAGSVGNHAAAGGMHDYMGDMMLVAGDSAKGREHYETALKHRNRASMNAANKAQAERTHLFKTALAAMIGEDLETANRLAADYAAAVADAGTAFEQRRVHELNGYLAMSSDDHETGAAELAKANQLDPIVLYWSAVAQNELGNTDRARELAYRAAYRNTLSPNLPFFRNEAIELHDSLNAT